MADPHPVTPTPTPAPGSVTANGRFQVSGGKIYDPDGALYYAHGVNIAGWAATGYGAPGDGGNGTNQGLFLRQLFPNCNMVRLACQREAPGTFDTFINNMTAVKCVVVLEDHNTDKGASWDLASSLAWYDSNAAYYKNYPYVVFGTVNEPNNDNQANALAAASNMKAIYDKIRATGNTNLVLLGLTTISI